MDSDWTTKEKREWTMIVFSELLKSFINEKNISVKKLAANVQMDRTLIQKYMSGSRVPKNYREVQKLADGMMLLPEQQGELLDAYYRNLYGDKTYEGYRKIAETLEGMKDFRMKEPALPAAFPDTGMPEEPQEEAEYVRHGKLEVEQAFISLLRKECERAGEEPLFIRMMMQPDQNEMLKLLLHAVGGRNVILEHILCLDCDGNNNENIMLIFSVLALAAECRAYHVYYYYDDIRSHINEMTLLPNMVLAGESVFLCNKERSECMILQKSAPAEFFAGQYNYMKKSAAKLAMHYEMEGADESILRDIQMNGTYMEFGYFPSVLLFPAERKSSDDAGNSREGTGIAGKYYFSERSLRAYLNPDRADCGTECRGAREDGGMSQDERINCVGHWLTKIREGQCRAYMADETKLAMEPGIGIFTGGRGTVGIWRQKKEKQLLLVKEWSVYDSLCGFEKFALDNDLFLDAETTTERIRQIWEESSK